MNKGIPRTTDDLRTKRFYHGTRSELKPGDLIRPGNPTDVDERDRMTTYVYLTPHLDEAIWDAELASGEGPGRVYIVEPTGRIGDASDLTDWKSPGHPSMSCCSREPLRVVGEVTEWSLYHGTRADLQPGDLIEPGYNSNYGKRTKAAFGNPSGANLAILRFKLSHPHEPLPKVEDMHKPQKSPLLTPPPLTQSRCIGTPPVTEEIELHRDGMWRRDEELRVESAIDAERFIEDVGFAKLRSLTPALQVGEGENRNGARPAILSLWERVG